MISQLGYLFLIRRKENKSKKEKYSNINKRRKNHSNDDHNKSNYDHNYNSNNDFDLNSSSDNNHNNSNENLYRKSLIYDKQKCLNCNGINYYNRKFCSIDCKSSYILKSSVTIPNYLS